QVNFSPSWGN
uniref:Neuropeptide Pec-HrTH n=1 Tax=Platypleura capensis TaxID=70904 RepID=Q7M465_9HEMI